MKRDILEKDLYQLMAGLYGPFELQQIEYNVQDLVLMASTLPARIPTPKQSRAEQSRAEHIIVPTELVLRKS